MPQIGNLVQTFLKSILEIKKILYCMSKMYCPNLYSISNLLDKLGQDFLDTQYVN